MSTIEGPSVRLRPIAPADYARVFAWYNDPEIVAPFDRFAVDTYDEFVRAVEGAGSDPNSLAPRFAIERRDEPGVIGLVGYYRAHPVLEYVDIWYVVGDRAARQHGHAGEAVGLLVGWLFQTLAVERIGATCDVENLPSYRLLERLGFRWEGTLRGALFHHTRWHDVRIYGVTRADWSARDRKASG